MKKITIAGYGFVGQAHFELIKDSNKIEVIDPAYNNNKISSNTNGVIVCVSTPMGTNGECNVKNVIDVIEKSPNVPILIKSTISIEGWAEIKRKFPDRMISFSPEFLRASNAIEDLQKMKLMLIGGDECCFWGKVFNISIEIAEPEELILAKYARNSFLALKVAFFNQMYDLCDKLEVEYSAVAHYTTMDERIGDSHSFITKDRGFGGHCFPKDTSALSHTAKLEGIDFSILNEAISYNKYIRDQ